MNQGLVKQEEKAALTARIALSGDLYGLKEDDIWEYYQTYCNYLGLDPVTRPFDILAQKVKDKDDQGREIWRERKTLYPNSSCSAQLASKHKISYGRPVYEYNEALKIVFCFVTLRFPNGREFTGESAVDKSGKSGLSLENALKKAATQARRRATLQSCGIALPDESEVEDIPNARGLAFVTPENSLEPGAGLRMIESESRNTEPTAANIKREYPELKPVKTAAEEIAEIKADLPKGLRPDWTEAEFEAAWQKKGYHKYANPAALRAKIEEGRQKIAVKVEESAEVETAPLVEVVDPDPATGLTLDQATQRAELTIKIEDLISKLDSAIGPEKSQKVVLAHSGGESYEDFDLDQLQKFYAALSEDAGTL